MPNNLVKAAAKQLEKTAADMEKEWDKATKEIIDEHNQKVKDDKEYKYASDGKLTKEGKDEYGDSPDFLWPKVTKLFIKNTGYVPKKPKTVAEAIEAKYLELFPLF